MGGRLQTDRLRFLYRSCSASTSGLGEGGAAKSCPFWLLTSKVRVQEEVASVKR
jgi:hypothetical protein